MNGKDGVAQMTDFALVTDGSRNRLASDDEIELGLDDHQHSVGSSPLGKKQLGRGGNKKTSDNNIRRGEF